jgi:hypothetical protein
VFTIYNDGDATLVIQNYTTIVSGSGFTLTSTGNMVAAHSNNTFSIQMLNAAGSYSGSVNIISNDPKGNFSFGISGTVSPSVHPKMRIVAGDGTVLSRGASYSMGSTPAGTPSSRGFTVYNDGTDPLVITNPDTVGLTGAAFALITPLGPPGTVTIAPGANAAFRIRLSAPVPGSYSGGFNLLSNDPAGGFPVVLTGTILGSTYPVIRIVSGDNVTVTRGSTYTIGSTAVNTALSRGFTIYNDGTATLDITNGTTLITGSGYAEVLAPSPTSVAPGSSTAFRVRLLSATAGTFTGTITIQSDDPAGPFSYTIKGTVN